MFTPRIARGIQTEVIFFSLICSSGGPRSVFKQCTRCLRYRGGTTSQGALGAALSAQTGHPRRHDETLTTGTIYIVYY